MKYIHYGSNDFQMDRFKPIQTFNSWCNKPLGGLWGSPLKPKNIGWKDWCIQEGFHVNKLDQYFIFSLKKDAKIYSAKTLKDIDRLKELIGHKDIYRPYVGTSLHFNILEQMGYDGFEVEMNDVDICMELYGWDVDSILIFNPDVIVLEP